MLGATIAVAVYAAWALVSDLEAVVERLRTFAWWRFGVALLLVLLGYGLRQVRWMRQLRRVGVDVPWSRAALAFYAGFAMTVTPGKVGEVIKAWLLYRSDGVRPEAVASVVVMERVTDVLALVLLTALGVGWGGLVSGPAAWTASVGGVMLCAAVLALLHPAWSSGLLRVLAARPRTAGWVPRIQGIQEATALLRGPAAGAEALGLATAAWALEGVALAWICAGWLGGVADVWTTVPVHALTVLLGAVSFVPGGVGVTELSMTWLLHDAGVVPDGAAAQAATTLIRVATLWFAVLLGVPVLLWCHLRWPARSGRDAAVSDVDGRADGQGP